jgi:hypothetical protein
MVLCIYHFLLAAFCMQQTPFKESSLRSSQTPKAEAEKWHETIKVNHNTRAAVVKYAKPHIQIVLLPRLRCSQECEAYHQCQSFQRIR